MAECLTLLPSFLKNENIMEWFFKMAVHHGQICDVGYWEMTKNISFRRIKGLMRNELW